MDCLRIPRNSKTKTNHVAISHWFGSLLVGVGSGFRETSLALVSGFSDPPGQIKGLMGKNHILARILGGKGVQHTKTHKLFSSVVPCLTNTSFDLRFKASIARRMLSTSTCKALSGVAKHVCSSSQFWRPQWYGTGSSGRAGGSVWAGFGLDLGLE